MICMCVHDVMILLICFWSHVLCWFVCIVFVSSSKEREKEKECRAAFLLLSGAPCFMYHKSIFCLFQQGSFGRGFFVLCTTCESLHAMCIRKKSQEQTCFSLHTQLFVCKHVEILGLRA